MPTALTSCIGPSAANEVVSLEDLLSRREPLDVQRGKRGQDRAADEQELVKKHCDFLSYMVGGTSTYLCNGYAKAIYALENDHGPRNRFKMHEQTEGWS